MIALKMRGVVVGVFAESQLLFPMIVAYNLRLMNLPKTHASQFGKVHHIFRNKFDNILLSII